MLNHFFLPWAGHLLMVSEREDWCATVVCQVRVRKVGRKGIWGVIVKPQLKEEGLC